MTAREKKLAIIAGAFVALLAVLYSANTLYMAFARRHREIRQLTKQLDDAQLQVKRGIRVADDIDQWAQRALPFTRDKAQSLYRQWIMDLAEELKIQVTNLSVGGSVRVVQGIYEEHTFNVDGLADLDQLTRLLYEIQFAPILHSMRSVTISASRERRELTFNMTIAAVAMPTAPDRQQLPRAKDAKNIPDLETYLRPILSRNLFGPENRPPQLRIERQYTLSRGQPFELAIRAEDPDPFDSVRVRIDPTDVPGARVSGSGDRLVWTPPRTGEYTLQVIAQDNGFPPRETTQQIRLVVQEPPPTRAPEPPPRPTFNPAKFAVITAVTHVDDQPQVWVTVRTEGKTLKLSIGEKFRIGDFEGEVVAVRGREVEIRNGNRTITARLGESILQ